MEKICKYCNTSFPKRKKETKSEFSEKKYCSKSCSNKANAGRGGFKKGHARLKKTTVGDFKKGQKPWNTGLPVRLNPKHEFKKGEMTGSKNHNWQGGKTAHKDKIRQSQNYKQWRMGVYIRDGFTCQSCGEVGGRLEAHHIKSFANFPELVFEISNGITLCRECHKLTDNYLHKARYKKDI